MRRPPCFLWEGRAEEWQGMTTRCAGMDTSCYAVVKKELAGRVRSGEQRRSLERRACVATMAGRTTPKMRKALPVGRAAHRTSLGVPGMVPSGEPGRRLQEPAPGFRCSYPPAGRCWASVPGHRHVRSHQCDAAPTRIAAAVRRAVTAAGSDGPICLMPSPVAPTLQQRAYSQGLLAASRCQPCSR